MKIVYMGTPDFAVPALEALTAAGHNIVAVVTQPDAVRDRGKKIHFSSVKEKAIELNLPVLQPEKVKKDPEFLATLKELHPDLIVVAAYGQILPPEVLKVPALGCVNIHGSLLPAHRGAAPIQRAILEGDKETGITIMFMEEGLDTGDMLAVQKTEIGAKNGAQLHDELAQMGAKLLVETLPALEAGTLQPQKQNHKEATYAHMIFKKDGEIDFSKTPKEIERQIRAFDPWPGAYTTYLGNRLKIWRAEATDVPNSCPPGTITGVSDSGIEISAGGTTLIAKTIQMPGKKRTDTAAYLKGNFIEKNTILG